MKMQDEWDFILGIRLRELKKNDKIWLVNLKSVRGRLR